MHFRSNSHEMGGLIHVGKSNMPIPKYPILFVSLLSQSQSQSR